MGVRFSEERPVVYAIHADYKAQEILEKALTSTIVSFQAEAISCATVSNMVFLTVAKDGCGLFQDKLKEVLQAMKALNMLNDDAVQILYLTEVLS